MGARIVEVTPEALRRQMLDAMARHKAPSVTFACAYGGKPVHLQALGLAKLTPQCAAVPATAYPWFSVTKLFTATAVLQLCETGRVEPDKPISDYLPDTRLKGCGVPTVRHLLSHTSGLANPIPISWVHLAGENGPSLNELTARLLTKYPKLSFAPGTRFSYSNLNYLLLGLLIERVSGEPFEDYTGRHVLETLGAKDTSFCVTPSTATGYSRPWSFMGIAARFMLDRKFFGATQGRYTELRPFAVDGAPYGGLVGPVADMLSLGRAMLARGEIGSRKILQEETADAALAPAKTPDGSPLPVGLGWHLGCIGSEHYAYHLGGGGFRSELRIYPRLDYAVAVIGNETSFPTESLACLLVRLGPPLR